MSKICGKSLQILQNSSKVLPTSTKNGPKSRKIRSLSVFGAKSRPGRLQDALPHLPGNPFGACLVENGAPRDHFGPQRGAKIGKKSNFWVRLAQGPSKNNLQKGVRKKHENLMKDRCKNGCFLMARNHVWHYTLRLFHTFALFEKM